MITRYSDFKKIKVHALDGEVGTVKDVLFDDKHWIIRYFVVDTSFWLPFKKVLMVPHTTTYIQEGEYHYLHTGMTKDQIEQGPQPTEDLPVSRQFEEKLHLFYGWNPWWGSPLTVKGPYKNLVATDRMLWNELIKARDNKFDESLRSTNEVMHYAIRSSDEAEFGTVSDFLLDTDDWTITDTCMKTSSVPFMGKEFICSPMYISDINYLGKVLSVDIEEENLLASPHFDFDNYNEKFRKTLVEIHCRKRGKFPSDFANDSLSTLGGSSAQF